MSCSIPDIKKSEVEVATQLFVGNSTTWNVLSPGVIEMPVTPKFRTTNQLFNIAMSNLKRVEKWAGDEKKYGPEFATGWLDRIDQSYASRIVVYLRFPNRLEKALEVRNELATLEEVNRDLMMEDVGEDFFMEDELLRFQQEREYEEFSNITEDELNQLINKKREC